MPVVLISGANRGLGLEFVRQYRAEGWEVIAGCRDPGAAAELNAVGGVSVHALDVADGASVASFAQAVGGRPLDLVIANAGVYGGQAQGFGEVDFDAWLQTLAVNTLAPVRLAQAFAPNLRAAKGKLIAISSLMGSIADSSGGFIIYRSSKAALNMAFKSVALALKGDGVTAAVLHPGWVQTDMGGKNAPVTPEQSIAGMRQVIAGLTVADAGSFHDYSGKALPW
jgi:NAD(P)-dependent dehydrogenase (short-subunit alcohol dehydrogenase family)